nr:MAG TPA: chlorophyll a/b-binding protein-like protein [Caudoviricetes sp.]
MFICFFVFGAWWAFYAVSPGQSSPFTSYHDINTS